MNNEHIQELISRHITILIGAENPTGEVPIAWQTDFEYLSLSTSHWQCADQRTSHAQVLRGLGILAKKSDEILEQTRYKHYFGVTTWAPPVEGYEESAKYYIENDSDNDDGQPRVTAPEVPEQDAEHILWLAVPDGPKVTHFIQNVEFDNQETEPTIRYNVFYRAENYTEESLYIYLTDDPDVPGGRGAFSPAIHGDRVGSISIPIDRTAFDRSWFATSTRPEDPEPQYLSCLRA